MTYGEEPGSEMHQDSPVLTYLEGLLMHQVAGGPDATAARRLEAGHSNQSQGNKAVRGYQLPNHGSGQEQERAVPHGASTQHLRKARLLCHEAWSNTKGPRVSVPVVDLNGQGGSAHAGAVDSVPQCKGESTLLASILQSFSNRLHTVALSQQIVQSLKQQDCGQVNEEQEEREVSPPCYGAASSRLKGLMKKNKMQSRSTVPYRRHSSQEKLPESPKALQGGVPPAASESISCAARLKAVANLVNIRSSPSASPKPSVACSQLALLLSSEAHLQQYSREQALKAQLSGRSASERLAAMATQQTQDKKQASAGQAQTAPDTLSSLHVKNGAQPQMALGSSKQSPSLIPGQSISTITPRTPHPFKERRPVDRQASRPAQNCSSLLLHLLSNHNTQSRVNGQGQLREDYSVFPGHSSPLLSDSEYSNTENSLPKDSSDAENSSSSCSPIDLSVRSRDGALPLGSSSSSLDKLTESLINTWKPETPRLNLAEARELETSVAIKPQHKVTLLQLLLDHKKNDCSPLGSDIQSVNPKMSSFTAGNLTPVVRCEEPRTQSPQCVMTGRNLQPLPTFCHGKDSSGSASPYSLYASPPSQSIPLDLCKPKPYSRENSSQEPAFSASKLLQNLAQCGLQNSASSPPLRPAVPPSKIQSHELNLDKPVTLLERLNSPVLPNKTTVFEGPHVNCVKFPFLPKPSPPVSEVENLLERRTVLQLLLGTASNKEKSSGRRKRAALRGNSSEKQTNKSESCGSSNGLVLDVKIKSEPGEEARRSDSDEAAERSQSRDGERDSHSPVSVLKQDIKTEPFSPDALPKDGLLSLLLKQQTRTCQDSMPEDSIVISVKEEHQEHRSPAIPKKRKFYLELHDHLNNTPCLSSDQRDTPQQSREQNSPRGTPEGCKVRKMASPPKANTPTRCLTSESPPSNCGGFNVLKQLLLSDNCLKDLSQHRGAVSPSALQVNCKVNGSVLSDFGHGHEPVGLRPNSSSQGSEPADLRQATTVVACNNSSVSPWCGLARGQEILKTSPALQKRDTDGPIRWANSGDRKQDSCPDSPRLTKTNPILYYMLQRGNTHLCEGGKEPEAVTGQCERQVKVKKEPVADVELNDHRVSLKHQQQLNNEACDGNPERLNGSVKKC